MDVGAVEGAVERKRGSVVGKRRNGDRPEVAGPQGGAGEVEHGVRGGDDEAGGEGERGVGAVVSHACPRLRPRSRIPSVAGYALPTTLFVFSAVDGKRKPVGPTLVGRDVALTPPSSD